MAPAGRKKTMKDINQIIAEETGKGNFSGQVVATASKSFEGQIRLTDSHITLSYNLSYENDSQQLAAQFPDRSEQIMRSLLRHEINHKGYASIPGCPGNLETTERLVETIATVLKRSGLPNVPVAQGHTLYTYVANMFADFVDNSQLGLQTDHAGMWLLYKNDLKGDRASPLFDFFVRAQEYTYGRKGTKRLLRGNHAKDKRVHEAVRGFIADTGLTRTNLHKLYQEDQWEAMAKVFTEKIVPLIDKNKISNPEYCASTFRALEGDGFFTEINTEDRQMARVWKKYQDQEEGGREKTRKGGFSPPADIESFDALRLLYQRLARNLELKVQASTREETMPVAWYQRRAFDPDKDSLSRSRLSVNRGGELELQVRQYPIEIPQTYHEKPHTLPEIRMAVLDTSDSTRENLGAKKRPLVLNPWAKKDKQWTDDAIYHYELLAWFGLVEYLRKQGALRRTSVKLANFSSSTKYADTLDAAYRIALAPQFGGTVLDPDAVFGNLRRKSLLFTLSDGEIANWITIKDDFIAKAKNHWYFHLQVGEATDMSRDVESAGLPVFRDDGRNLGKMVIDLTRQYVSQGKAQQMRYLRK